MSTTNYKQKGVTYDIRDRFLFKGESCFPLSPTPKTKSGNNVVNNKDQLKIINDVLGLQSKYDTAFITDDLALNYQKTVNNSKDKTDFQNLFQKSSPKLVELLKSMLEFNPYFRSSAAELLKNSIFDTIRVPKFEKPSSLQLDLNIDSPN